MARTGPNMFARIRAEKAFEDFTGHKADKISRAKLDDKPVTGYRMGDVVGIAYEAKRDGETAQYFHRFKKRVRPELVARNDGRQLYIAGGKYKVTDRGIEDMPELFVVNPSRRKKRRAKSSSPKRQTFMRNPTRRRRRRARAAAPARATVYRRNPIRRRRRRSVAVAGRRYRRNPSSRSGGGKMNLLSMIMPAAMVGAGAVGAEVLMGYLPIPANMKTGPMRYVVKAAVSIGAGMLLSKMGQRKLGEAFAMGGIAISAHDALKDVIVGAAPNTKFGGWKGYGYNIPMNNYPSLGYYSAGPASQMGMYTQGGMGQYVQGGMGEYSGT